MSKGYGFVTFETEQEAQRLQSEVSDFCLKKIISSHFEFHYREQKKTKQQKTC